MKTLLTLCGAAILGLFVALASPASSVKIVIGSNQNSGGNELHSPLGKIESKQKSSDGGQLGAKSKRTHNATPENSTEVPEPTNRYSGVLRLIAKLWLLGVIIRWVVRRKYKSSKQNELEPTKAA